MPSPRGVAQSSPTDVPFGTAETLIFASPPARGVMAGQKVLVIGWTAFQTGGTQTTTTLRLRRGTGVAGTEISNSAAEAIYAAAGAMEDHVVLAIDNAAEDDPIYSLTGSTGVAAASSLQHGIAVIPIG